jgi:ankyrin repeat protein
MREIDEEFLKACRDGDLKKVKQLLKEGVDVNTKDEDGWTALMYACLKGEKKVAEFLIEKGVDVNAKDKNGRTALMIAKENGYDEIFKLLKSTRKIKGKEDKMLILEYYFERFKEFLENIFTFLKYCIYYICFLILIFSIPFIVLMVMKLGLLKGLLISTSIISTAGLIFIILLFSKI